MAFDCASNRPSSNSTNGTDEHEHAHDHDHADDGHGEGGDEEAHAAHGPNGGHIFKFDSPEYVGEWQKFSDNNVIKMHILDKDQKAIVNLKVRITGESYLTDQNGKIQRNQISAEEFEQMIHPKTTWEDLVERMEKEEKLKAKPKLKLKKVKNPSKVKMALKKILKQICIVRFALNKK